MRSTYNNFLLDGLDNNSYGTSNQGYSAQLVQPSPDALAEFKVITSNYSAEYGRVGGAVVNAVMKSGTNQFHGSAYEFLRNTDLNATGFLFSPAVFVKPTLQRNQFGATIGGPIVKNKLFFFGDYEGFRQLQRYLNFDSIPSMTDRQGILPVTVVNPLTGVVYPANTQIPIAQLNPFAATVLSGLPPTNGPGRSNNDEALLLIRDYGDKFDAKLDGQINDRMTAFLRFSQRKDLQYYAARPHRTVRRRRQRLHSRRSIRTRRSATPGPSRRPRSSKLAWVSRTCSPARCRRIWAARACQSMFGGFQGLPTTPNLTGGLNTQTITGLTALGRQTSNPQFQNPTSWDPKLNYSKTMGRHSLKVGYEFLNIRTEILDTNPLYGQDTYSGAFSKPTCAQLGQPAGCTIPTDSTSYNLADFMFGTPNQINLGSYTVVNLRQFVHSLYFQDDYRVSSKLTLNVGLRWEFASPLYERDNNYSNFDPTTNTMIKATSGSLFNRGLVHPDYKDFGPRLGLAYSIDSEDRGPRRIRDQLHVLQPARQRAGGHQRSAGPVRCPQPVDSGGRPGAVHLPHHAEQLHHQHRQPRGLQSGQFQRGLHPAGQQMAVHSELVPLGAAATPQEHGDRGVLQRKPQPAAADHRRLQSGGSRTTRARAWAYTARVPIPTFGPITWLDPAGDNHYNGLSARVEHRFAKGLYVLNSFTWGKAMGDSEQALEYYAGYYQANPQNIHNLAAEKGPSSFDVKLNNVTSVVYQLPFGKGRQFGANMNPVVDAVRRRMGTQQHQHRAHGHAARRDLRRDRGQHCQLAFQRLSRPAVPAPQRDRQRRQPEPLADAEHLFRRLHVHHAAGQRAVRQCGPQCVPRSQLRPVGLLGRQELPDPRERPAAIPGGVLQRSEPHQFRNTEYEDHRCRLRHHPHHLPVAAGPVRAEADVLRIGPPLNAR